MSKVAVQLLSYNGEKFLAAAIASVKAQTFPNFDLYVLDNASTDSSRTVLTQALSEFPRPLVFEESASNLGFSGGHNKLYLLHASEYVLCLNQDVTLGADYLQKLVAFMNLHPRAGSVSGKLLREPGIIDSVGLRINRARAVKDIEAGAEDKGRYAAATEVFGVSGAAVLYRREALRDVSEDSTLFDESFFAYKEDVDLAWRLRLRGWESYMVGETVATHVRSLRPETAAGGERRAPHSVERQRWSSRNHLTMVFKNETSADFWRDGLRIIGYEIAKWVYLLIHQPRVVTALGEALGRLPETRKKRKFVQSRKTHSIREWINRA